MQNYEVEFYELPNGGSPIEEFLSSLEIKMKAKVLKTISLLENNGNELREPYTKLLEDGIFELRIKQSNDIARVLYFFKSGKKIILTNGFIKKTQKTPKREIEKAKKYKADYENQLK